MTEWQTIDTAPKDGRQILLYGQWYGEINKLDENMSIYLAEYIYDEWSVVGGDYYASNVVNPTHWMPSPEPPK